MKDIPIYTYKTAIISASVMIAIVLVANNINSLQKQSQIINNHIQLSLRQIGHQFLSESHDPHSLIMPVTQTDQNTYQINFQHSFSFVPDSLVKIVQTAIEKELLPAHITVNVKDKDKQAIVYGFEINKEEELNIIPCLGRPQPVGRYQLEIGLIGFSPQIISSDWLYLFFALLIGILIISITASKLNGMKILKSGDRSMIEKIGNFTFDRSNNLLKYGNQLTELTEKESKLLSILYTYPNQLVSRDFLLKEVWENEGVFTGRSLDVFLSRLRKKLTPDPSLQIANVHGKGYILKIGVKK